jgi:hypothetical protein
METTNTCKTNAGLKIEISNRFRRTCEGEEQFNRITSQFDINYVANRHTHTQESPCLLSPLRELEMLKDNASGDHLGDFFSKLLHHAI